MPSWSRETTKAVLKQMRLYGLYKSFKKGQPYREWIARGRPLPAPDFVKHNTVLEFAGRFNVPVFIETGTYLGNMLSAVKHAFPKVYSIELGKDLFEQARRNFAGDKHVTILLGDSGEILGQILDRIQQPCLFWLDGHFSEGITARSALDTPIRAELSHILKHPMARRHIILIDDARLFTGELDYPTIQELEDLTAPCFSHFEVRDDIVRIFNR